MLELFKNYFMFLNNYDLYQSLTLPFKNYHSRYIEAQRFVIFFFDFINFF